MTPDELRAALIGTWRLVSYEATSVDDGEVVRPYGEHPLGLIMYTADGYMSAQITTPDRPLFGEQRQEYGSPEELAEAADAQDPAAGTYTYLLIIRIRASCATALARSM
jgi:hypothetical protein